MKFIIKILLWLNNIIYRLIVRFSTKLNNGIHPKHQIIKYKEWFYEQIKPDWVVLDIGSNTGLLPFLLAEKAKYVYGIEINKAYYDSAKKKRQKNNIEYINADATKYSYDSCFPINCVTLSNVLEHIENRIDFLKQLIESIKWANKKEKIILFRVPMLNRDWLTIYKRDLGVQYRLDPTHFIEYTFETFQQELDVVGIKIEKYEIKFGEIYAVCRAV